ncbi:hypothetical protein ACIA8G_38550 [Lentzea sp. NPDC051213]|uniref:hypothetical protein n=1 Tax=Lentzea sp. NPDC051213 TaxID=3364126 RepID=UPI0037A306B5
MIRKMTVAALVLSAVPAALALSLFSGTAQADPDTPWIGSPPSIGVTSDDTPWLKGLIPSDGDTPWQQHIKVPADGDTPWR